MPFSPGDQARAASRRGVEARAARRQERERSQLTLARVEAQLPPLASLKDAKERLDRIGTWAVAGLLPGTVTMAAVRSVEVWVRAHEASLTQEVAERLRSRLDAVEADLRRSRMGVAR
jgi:hypothetical protein